MVFLQLLPSCKLPKVKMVIEEVKEKQEKPPRLGGGPCGLGDPDDMRLRKTEKDIIIPKMIREEAKKRCSVTFNKFLECSKREGLLFPFRCQKENEANNDCIIEWTKNSKFQEEMTKKYIEARSHFRKTGEPLKN